MKIGKSDSIHYDLLGVQSSSGTGVNGTDGKSAYEIAVLNGYVGTEAQWVAGLEGIPGPAGIQGPQGEVGPKGDKGEPGIQGLQGNTGTAGYTPVKGVDYFDGSVGPQGPQGIQGVKGDTGNQGTQGSSGNSAYQIAIGQGYVGTEAQWVISLKGEQGIQGIKGDTGLQGPQGVAGSNGTNGITPVKNVDYFDGVTGPQGPKGDTGLTGPSGSNGVDGAQGIQGIQGIQGPAGTNGTNGTNGVGVPIGGTTGQVLSKINATDYNTQWITPTSGGATDHTLLTNIGTNTHSQIDTALTRLANTSGSNTGDQDLSGYSLTSHTHTGVYEPANATILKSANIGTTVQGYSANLASWSGLATSAKQDTLVSATNIKTINGASVLGSGDLVVSGGGGLSATTAVMTATQQNTTVTEANVTQLALAMVANGVYQVDAFITFQSAATTTGAKIGFTSPASCRCMVEVVVPITSTAVASQLRTIFPNAAVATNIGVVIGTGVTAINSNHTARISGIIRNGANAGNFQVTFASEVAASAITLQIGSELQLIRIA